MFTTLFLEVFAYNSSFHTSQDHPDELLKARLNYLDLEKSLLEQGIYDL